jgi:hypothetical protein
VSIGDEWNKDRRTSWDNKPDLLAHYRPRVVIKFRERDQPYDDAALQYIPDAYLDVDAWKQLEKSFQGVFIERLFVSLPPARIKELVEISSTDRSTHKIARAERRSETTYRPPNFLTYFGVRCPSGVNPHAVANALAAWDIVEVAYVESPPTRPPTVNPSNDPLFPANWSRLDSTGSPDPFVGQSYLTPAPVGIDAKYAWDIEKPPPAGFSKSGGDGNGLHFVDIEQGWTLNHQDLIAASIPPSNGANLYFHGHGTAVLGIVRAVDNIIGCIGIAPNVTSTHVVSEWRVDPDTGEIDHNRADAIMAAIAMLSPGDVLLLEMQTDVDAYFGNDPHPQTFSNLPVEIQQTIFDLIKTGTELHDIVIVEAAGNGGMERSDVGYAGYDLDGFPWGATRVVVKDATSSNRTTINSLNRSSSQWQPSQDSGAIMVAGGQVVPPPGGVTALSNPTNWKWTRWTPSNFGSRIDCFAWADAIVTIGGLAGGTTDTTDSFFGTSGASAIIAGAALSVQGLAQANHGFRFDPLLLRSILSDLTIGTRSVNSTAANPNADKIRVMPDLRNIITQRLNIISTGAPAAPTGLRVQ